MQNHQRLISFWRPFLKTVALQTVLVASASPLAFAHRGIAPPTLNHNRVLEQTITGKVVSSEDGLPVIGVNVVEKGTTNGTVTDAEGKYSLTVSSDKAVLLFSFIGFLTEETAVGNRTTLDVKLVADVKTLSEVVVVGYGVQKKSVVTGAISSVKAADMENMAITRVDQALQGRASGLTIAATSGQPGSNASILVRGVTSLGGDKSNPLWVVDGVVIDAGGIGYLNQSDIESIEVLKDASSQAIYGARAAAGVILVTTKKGKAGTMRVNYSGYYGTSAPARKLDLLDATQYATLRNEAFAAAAYPNNPPLPFADPQSLGKGTDWQAQVFNSSARRQNHEISISGGSEKSTFYASFGYLEQQGIVATAISNFARYNLRLNSEHKVASWLKIGQNLGYSKDKTVGLGNTNSEFGGPLSSAITLDPITPVVVTDPAVAGSGQYVLPGIRRDANGNPYGLSSEVKQEINNPLAYISTRLGNYGWADNVVGNVYAEVEPIKGLKFRSSLGTKFAYYGSESFTPISYLSSSSITTRTSFNRDMNQQFYWNLENTVSYNKIVGDHDFAVLLGQGAYQDGGTKKLNVTFQDMPADNFEDASFNYKSLKDARLSDASEDQFHTVSSVFARLNYNYKEKYLLTGVIRRDGSSHFGSNKRYGIFPSFSMGWVVSKESFWPTNNVVDFLKLRGGYGVVGNDYIDNFAFLSTIGSGRNYTFGTSGNSSVGNSPNAPANPDLKWEETHQTNFGFDATLFRNFNLTVEWFNKTTKDLLQNPYIPLFVGAVGRPAANVGNMENTGVELELGYQKKVGDVNFSVKGNTSFIQNKITFLGNGVQFREDENFQNLNGSITRTVVGQPYASFYGYKTLGIFQTQEEVNNYRDKDGKMIQPNAKPGDFRWFDKDGDGQITQADRDFLGKSNPTVSYGFTFNVAYKGFDLVFFGQGAAGNKIFQGLRRLDIAAANWQTAALNRWTGPGTSDTYPRLVEGDPNKNFINPSDFYLQKGDYFRIKTLQLGYTLPTALLQKMHMQKIRIYVMSENLATFTKYTGYDPEIGGNVLGVDRGRYPQARSFMVGLNVGF
jgi:TonB-linked SusC/RagA family outer membrane protein